MITTKTYLTQTNIQKIQQNEYNFSRSICCKHLKKELGITNITILNAIKKMFEEQKNDLLR